MTDPQLGYTVYRSDPTTAVGIVEQLGPLEPLPRVPAWVLVSLVDKLPLSSAYHLSNLIPLTLHNAELAYWLHTPEAWRMAVQLGNGTIGVQLRRPKKYGVAPTSELETAHGYTSVQSLDAALDQLANPFHRLYNNPDPARVVVTTSGDDPQVLANLFWYHYWELMEHVLPHRWDLVEYLIHAFGWTDGELGTVLDTLPRASGCQPGPQWFVYWYQSGIARVPMSSMLNRLDLRWLHVVWMSCYGNPFAQGYIITPLDCYQLQTQCSTELQRVAFTLPKVRWTALIQGYSFSALQLAIMDNKFKVKFTDRGAVLLVPRIPVLS
jgi:hypothetical protein